MLRVSRDCNSFRGDTLVTTPTGQVPIDTLQVGDPVIAYDMATGQSQPELVQHVFINNDNNLLDVTLALPSTNQKIPASDTLTDKQQISAVQSYTTQTGPVALPSTYPASTETIHTTTEHPFLTTDRGFVDAVKLILGEHIKTVDGTVGTVVTVQALPGVATRFNLAVKDIHSFTVGDGHWVVHNCPIGGGGGDFASQAKDAVDAINNPKDIAHIFDKPGHNWDVTTLDREGNLNLIKTVAEKGLAESRFVESKGVSTGAPRVVQAFTNPQGVQYLVKVSGVLVDGALRLSNAMIEILG